MADNIFINLSAPTVVIAGGADLQGGILRMPLPALVCSGSINNPGEALLELPRFYLASAGYVTPLVASLMVLPSPELSIVGSIEVLADTNLELPLFVVSITGSDNITGDVAIVMPTIAVQVLELLPDAAGMTLPVPTLVVTGTPGVVASVELSMPGPIISAGAGVGVIGSVVVALPAFAVDTRSSSIVALVAPALSITVVGQVGAIGAVSMRMPASTPVITSDGVYTGQVVLSTIPQVVIAGTAGASARVDIALRALALAADGYTGVVGSASMVLPVMQMSANGYIQHVGDVVLVLPVLQLLAVGQGAGSATFNTMAMHTETSALTSYDNYNFNSFALFNGVYLGAKSDGIFALSGATDNGTLIQAAARLGLTDFGTSHLKRIDRCYMGYRADGDMILRVTVDELTTRDYLVRATGKSGLHGNHVDIGKGIKARYWQYEVRNKDGADFSLDVMELKPTVLRRRIGGGDA